MHSWLRRDPKNQTSECFMFTLLKDLNLYFTFRWIYMMSLRRLSVWTSPPDRLDGLTRFLVQTRVWDITLPLWQLIGCGPGSVLPSSSFHVSVAETFAAGDRDAAAAQLGFQVLIIKDVSIICQRVSECWLNSSVQSEISQQVGYRWGFFLWLVARKKCWYANLGKVAYRQFSAWKIVDIIRLSRQVIKRVVIKSLRSNKVQ